MATRNQGPAELAEEIYRLVCQGRRGMWLTIAHNLEARGESMFTWQIVSWVSRNGPTTQRDLSYALAQHPAGISRQVDELQAAGLVRRRAVKDRRRLLVEATPKGRRWFRANSAEAMLAVDRALVGLSSPQRQALRQLMRGLVDAMGITSAASRKPFPLKEPSERHRASASAALDG